MAGYRVQSMIAAGMALLVPVACAGPTGSVSAESDEAVSYKLVKSDERPAASVVKSEDVLKVFEPQPDGRDVRIDYEFTDMVLKATVLRTGPSERVRYSRPSGLTGSKVRRGSLSRYRLEGNKIVYSLMNDDTKAAVTQCVESLIALGQRLDIPRLPRNEQLAYWMNLHNMLVIATLTKHYPVPEPRRLTFGPDKLPFHEAPMVELKGVALSLNDIRVGIVYRYWNDPRVMYGFFRGDLAGPSIRADAWSAETLSATLTANARRFVNSLRAVRRRGRGALVVSPVYDEARDQFFPSWPNDLRTHLLKYAGADARLTIERATDVVYGRYEREAADLTGGRPGAVNAPFAAFVWMPGGAAAELWGPQGGGAALIALGDIQEKRVRYWLRQKPGRVIIEDAPFTDEPPGEVVD